MKFLFIHQNFPGQFKFLAPELKNSGHDVHALMMRKQSLEDWHGIKIYTYFPDRGTSKQIHPWISDFETKIIRAEACYKRAIELKKSGFEPDIVVAHPGWGESLFIKDLWPNSKLAIYCEFFYNPEGADVGFDPEFPSNNELDQCRLKLKNINNLLHFPIADAAISPTHWQASTFPADFQNKITVIHDGIDTKTLIPNPSVVLNLNGNLRLSKSDEVITFVNRNLEPYRGYHVFMRALPSILERRPNAKILIVGGNDVSYGAKPSSGLSWKDIFIKEVRPSISDENWKRVFFLGNIPYEQFIPLLQLSTVHVYLTYPFVLSWSLIEAMSIGCAIVASDTSPLHEVIEHNETGRLVNFFDISGMVEEICHLLENPDERFRLGRNARKHAIANYDLRDICLPKQLKWITSLK